MYHKSKPNQTLGIFKKSVFNISDREYIDLTQNNTDKEATTFSD